METNPIKGQLARWKRDKNYQEVMLRRKLRSEILKWEKTYGLYLKFHLKTQKEWQVVSPNNDIEADFFLITPYRTVDNDLHSILSVNPGSNWFQKLAINFQGSGQKQKLKIAAEILRDEFLKLLNINGLKLTQELPVKFRSYGTTNAVYALRII